MPGSLGLGLNLGGLTSGGSGGGSSITLDGATFWSFEQNGQINLQPDAKGTISDYNILWDLDSGDYMPQSSPSSDGYWDVDDLGSGNYEIKPKNV